jgi:hypothetical protein
MGRRKRDGNHSTQKSNLGGDSNMVARGRKEKACIL